MVVEIRFVTAPSAETVITYFAPPNSATFAVTSAYAITPCAAVQSFVSVSSLFVTSALSMGAANLVTSSASALYSAFASAGSYP